MRACFKDFLQTSANSFRLLKNIISIFLLFQVVFAIIFVLFLANAIIISSLNKTRTAREKYSNFFPPFSSLTTSKLKKGYAIQFDFEIGFWKCKYDGRTKPPLTRLCKEFQEFLYT
jgi:hypothetical protein